MADAIIRMKVNGTPVETLADPSYRLLDFLREDLHLTGTKEGCGAGECGTCSVFVDGVLKKSCLVPLAKVRDCEVNTVESLAENRVPSIVQRAFFKTGASQCGFCIPGFVMASTNLLRLHPHADLERIKEGLGGNICRCTGYQKIFEAVELARDVMNGTLPPQALDEPADREAKTFIGARVRRQDTPAKVSGTLKYAADIFIPGMTHLKVLRSTHPHALISVDTAEAETMPGVLAVLTSQDVPGVDGYGVFVVDQPVLARDRVRHVGEGIAAVVAESVQQAEKALEKIRVRYQPLEAVFDPEKAMLPGAPVLNEAYPDNILRHVKIRKGDVDKAFAGADLVVEETYDTQRIEHAYLEPEAGVAYR
ncbi:MAG: 2Fe-2S iron-sulfur cluster-binding protein, partial [Deltaproteobacteria bacterium]|nr:2Fe-2S iron-sulfur cluster-binding protein [Deltaproteobacteria bacterium]